VVSVSRHAKALLDQCRIDRTPAFLEAVTYRWRGHVGPAEDQDVGVDRKVDLLNWKRRDPLSRLAAALLSQGEITQPKIDAIASAVQTATDGAWARALSDPLARPDQLLDYVYAMGAVPQPLSEGVL